MVVSIGVGLGGDWDEWGGRTLDDVNRTEPGPTKNPHLETTNRTYFIFIYLIKTQSHMATNML